MPEYKDRLEITRQWINDTFKCPNELFIRKALARRKYYRHTGKKNSYGRVTQTIRTELELFFPEFFNNAE